MPRFVVWTNLYRGEHTIINARRVQVTNDSIINLDGKLYPRSMVHHYNADMVSQIVAEAENMQIAEKKLMKLLSELNKPT